MGVCFSQTVLIDANPINHLDKRIQKQQGLKTAQQLAEQNNRFADDVDKFEAKVKGRLGPQEEGKWGATRQTLAKATNMTQFAHQLNLTQHKMQDALTQFQALDKDGNGVIDQREFAGIFKLDPDCEKTTYMFNALDVNRDGQLNYKEFLVVAAHFNSAISDADKARFCFKMVDDNNDGVVTYEELKRFLLDVMYSESSAKHRMVAKVDKLITEKLGFQTYDRLKEQEFAELVVNNKSTFTPMLALYSSLNKLFTHAFEPSSAKHTTQEVKQYFNQDGSGESGEMVDDDYGGGGGGGERRNSAGEYSPAAARSAAKGEKKPNFQHEFQKVSNKKKNLVAVPWERDDYGGNRAVNPWDSGEPPSLQRKISQDDSMHDYDGGYNSKKSLKVRGGRWNGNTVDLDADSKEITANDRVGGLIVRTGPPAWAKPIVVPRDREENVADDASPRQPPQMRRTLSKSLDEEDFHRAVKSRHPPANAKGNLMHSSTSDDLRGDLKPLKKLQEVPRWAKML